MFDGGIQRDESEELGTERRTARYQSALPIGVPSGAEPGAGDDLGGWPLRCPGVPRTEPAGEPVDAEERRAQLHADLDRWLDSGADDGGHGLASAIVGVDRLQRAIDGAAVAVLPAFDASMQWAAEAHRSPISWLVGQTGRARSDCSSWRRSALDASRLPLTAAAAAEGRLTRQHLKVLAHTRRAPVEALFDRDEADLVEAAVAMTVDGFEHHARRWYQDALEELRTNEPDGPEPDTTDGNRLKLHATLDGRGVLDLDLDPLAHAAVRANLDHHLDALRRNGALEHDPRTLPEIYGDIAAPLLAGNDPGTASPATAPLLIATVDLDTLLRRAHPTDDPDARTQRRAELLGHGPLTDAQVHELARLAGISLLITENATSHPLWYGRSRRLATPAQRQVAIALSNGHCDFDGCTIPAHRCDIDHLTGWTQGGTTDIDNLALRCPFHNRLKHRWALTTTRQPDGTLVDHWPNGQPLTPPTYTHDPPHHSADPEGSGTDPPDPASGPAPPAA